MTWVIGTAPPFGYAILVSDICVKFKKKDGSEEYHDCLQKIYPLGPAIMGGFAGSVKIGFAILYQLQRILSNIPSGQGWSLNVIGNTWLPRVIRRVYNSMPESCRMLGASIILGSVHPNLKCGDSPWAQTDIYTFRSPDFKPLRAGPFEVVSIGKGSDVDAYKSVIRNLSEDFTFTKAATFGEVGQATFLAHTICTHVEESPTIGISTFFQIGLINNKRILIHNHEYRVFNHDGSMKEIKFPKIAKNYKEFEDFCQDINCQAKEAVI